MRPLRSDLANMIGTHVLPFTNPRVVSPPGRIVSRGRTNLIVATPMRSGTHILIDPILNNLPAYRNRPLYINLDQCAKPRWRRQGLLEQIGTDAGYVIKTHMPIDTPEGMPEDPHVRSLISEGCVVTVRRARADVCRSLARWHQIDQDTAETRYGPDHDRFWTFWEGRAQIALAFEDLFDPGRMGRLLKDLAARSGSAPRSIYAGPPAGQGRARIHANKTLTRLLGRHAPRVDTTIHTLKR